MSQDEVLATTLLSKGASNFSARLAHLHGDAVILLEGELVAGSANLLRDVLRPFVAEGPSRLILDLAEVTLLDSSSLAVLIWAQQHLVERSARLVVRSAAAARSQVLEISELLDYLGVETSEADTEEGVSPGRGRPRHDRRDRPARSTPTWTRLRSG